MVGNKVIYEREMCTSKPKLMCKKARQGGHGNGTLQIRLMMSTHSKVNDEHTYQRHALQDRLSSQN